MSFRLEIDGHRAWGLGFGVCLWAVFSEFHKQGHVVVRFGEISDSGFRV